MYAKLFSKLSKMDPKTLVSFPILLCTVPMVSVALPLSMLFIAIYGSYRTVNHWMKILLRPDLLDRLNCLTQSYTSNWYGPTDPNIIQVSIVKGPLHPETVSRELRRNFQNPNLRRLQQFPVDFGGYYYWKAEKDFNISNHVKYLNPSVFLKQDLEILLGELIAEKWTGGKSPWEVLVINNYFEDANIPKEYSVIILRAHQCFHDIYQNILLRTKPREEPLTGRSTLNTIFYPFIAIQDLIKLRMKLHIPEEWYDRYDNERVSVKNFRTKFSKVQSQDLQKIAQKLNVNSDAVLQGVLSMLLHRALKNKGFFSFDNLSVSKNSKFRVISNLPENNTHVIENIKRAFAESRESLNSTVPNSWDLHLKAVGFIPTCFHGSTIYQPKISLDQVQGPKDLVTFGGHEIRDLFKLGSFPGDSSEGISIVCHSYKEEITISLSVFNLYFPGEVLENFGGLVEQELLEVRQNLRI
ncbi:unnamed protein product [Allacma fusca]|uniref:Diacylglycerol O-acyltransferase n=1 Tax=Allacma fusca TaxID=39272 RepID=A0A8J2LMB4_9HEXA|nr:unnamed protein product [Allacma fusca]